jgi:hypothetical protein
VADVKRWLAVGLTVGVLSVAATGVTACAGRSGGRQGAATTTAPTAAATSGTPSVTATGEEGVGGSAGASVLADGRHPVYLTGLDLSGRTVTFDLIQFLTGAAAKDAWIKEHPEEPEGPPNDYFIANDNQRLRTLPLADAVEVTVVDTTTGGVTSAPIRLADLPAHLAQQKPEAGDRRLSYNPYWLTVAHGQVTRIEEQFIP